MGQRIQGKGFGKREGRIDLGYLGFLKGRDTSNHRFFSCMNALFYLLILLGCMNRMIWIIIDIASCISEVGSEPLGVVWSRYRHSADE